MSNNPKFFVGQEVTYFTRPERGTRVKVVRVARKYGYIELHGRQVPFNLETGYGHDAVGHGNWVMTDEDIAEKEERALAMARVEPLTRSWSTDWRYLTVDQISRIADILDEPRG